VDRIIGGGATAIPRELMAAMTGGNGPPPDLAHLIQKAERAHDMACATVANQTLHIDRDYPGKHNCELEASKLLLRSLNRLSGKNEKKGGNNDEENDGA
jgi:hypothetical protein